jgi:membrane-associated phospholipid phosphatase
MMVKELFSGLPKSFVRAFAGTNAFWHVLAIVLTYASVTTGFDWRYYESSRSELIFLIAFPAAVIGFFVPVFAPLSIYIYGKVRKIGIARRLGAALIQAAVLASIIAALYKTVTGRLQPELVSTTNVTDISNAFNFGFFRHGIFWGWPSSHTTVAFALSAVIIAFFPRRKGIVLLAALYALYIGLGVSVTIHWFSDFLAGAIIGSVIGLAVAKGQPTGSRAG